MLHNGSAAPTLDGIDVAAIIGAIGGSTQTLHPHDYVLAPFSESVRFGRRAMQRPRFSTYCIGLAPGWHVNLACIRGQ